jgi:hypothetical protein
MRGILVEEDIMELKEAAARYKEILSDLEDLEIQAKELMDERDYLVEKTIPQLMHEAGQSSCELETGEKVSLETIWNIEVPKVEGINDYSAIAAWLKEKGFDAIIQNQIKVQKGVDISGVLAEMEREGIGYDCSSSVHWQSLRKVIKEHMETGGDAPPESAARVNVFECAKIKGGDK